MNIHYKLIKGFRYIHGGVIAGGIVVPFAVQHIYHPLCIAAHLLLHAHLVYLGSQCHYPVGYRACIAHKTCRAALKEVVCILADAEGADMLAFEYGLVQVLIQTHQLVGMVKHYLIIQPAEIHLKGGGELLAELIVFLTESAVFQKLCHGKAVCLVAGQVYYAKAAVAYQLTFNIVGKKSLYLAAADGTGLSFIKQTHSFPPKKI